MGKKFVFCSVPDFSDNARAMFEFMWDRQVEGTYIWLFNDSSQTNNRFFDEYKNKRVKFIKKNSWLGMHHYLTASFSFSDHGIFNKIPLWLSPKKIELWHGMPLKQIGNYNEQNTIFFHKTISTAPIFDEVLNKAFGIKDENLISCGLPRNDKLFQRPSTKVSQMLFNNDAPIVAWLPTFRKHISGQYNDGDAESNKLGFFEFEELKNLDNRLIEADQNLFIKLHPLDILNKNENLDNSFERIRIFNTAKFESQFLDLYKILADVDCLITDYSSVYFDFLLTKKPIGLMEVDSKQYRNTRGLIKEIEENIKGIKINNKEEFLDFILNNEKTKLDYNELNEIFQARDKHGNNSEFICSYLNLIDESKKI